MNWPAPLRSLFERAKKHKLYINAISLTFLRPFSLIVGLVTAPLFLNYLGDNVYGIYSLFQVQATRVIIYDLGLQILVTREFSMLGQRDGSYLRSFLLKVSSIYCLIGFLFAVALLAFGRFGYGFMQVSEQNKGTFFTLSACAAATSFVYMCLRPCEAIIDGMELHVVRNIPALFSGFTLIVLAALVHVIHIPKFIFFSVSFFSLCLSGVWNLFMVFRLGVVKKVFGHSAETPKQYSYKMLFRQSGPIIVNQVMSMIQTDSPSFLIGHLAGERALTVFSLAMRPVFFIRIITSQASLAFMPRMVQFNETRQFAELARFAGKIVKLIILLSISLALVYMVWAVPFLQVWLRSRDQALRDEVLLPSILVALAYSANSLGSVTGRCLNFIGEAHRLVRLSIGMTLVMVACAYVLGSIAGSNAVILVLLAQNIVTGFIIDHLFKKHLGLKNEVLLDRPFLLLLAALGGFAALIFATAKFWHPWWLAAIPASLFCAIVLLVLVSCWKRWKLAKI